MMEMYVVMFAGDDLLNVMQSRPNVFRTEEQAIAQMRKRQDAEKNFNRHWEVRRVTIEQVADTWSPYNDFAGRG